MTPWELAKPGCKEDREQAALFAWANCAAIYGFDVAGDARAYNKDTRPAIMGYWPSPPVPLLKRLFAIHNQGHGDAIHGGKARAEGVKKGVPDLMLPVPKLMTDQPAGSFWFHGLFIELKRLAVKPKRATSMDLTSDSQDDWIGFLTAQGYRCNICYGWQEATVVIRDYLK